jgi:hypothetical protein
MKEEAVSGLVIMAILTLAVAVHEASACWAHLKRKLCFDGGRRVMDDLCEARHDDR